MEGAADCWLLSDIKRRQHPICSDLARARQLLLIHCTTHSSWVVYASSFSIQRNHITWDRPSIAGFELRCKRLIYQTVVPNVRG